MPHSEVTATPDEAQLLMLTQAPAPSDTPVVPTEASVSSRGCESPGLIAYTSARGDYCFAYPERFTLQTTSADGAPLLSGPALDQGPEPLRASMSIDVQPVTGEAVLDRLIYSFLSQDYFQGPPASVARAQITLGGQPAEVLEGVPGKLNSRLVMTLHEGNLYTLRFHPSEMAQTESDLEALYDAVTNTFRFTPGTPEYAAPSYEMDWLEFEHVIRVSFDPAPALWVDVATIPAVPLDPSIMFAESHPAVARFRFLGYQGGMASMLPYPFSEAQLNIYATKDFPGYGDDQPTGFSPTLEQLRGLLADRPELSMCDTLQTGTTLLPFLPWLNSAQVFCAHPAYVQFGGGSGIRYLSTYSQGVDIPTDDRIFYSFQGLSEDGELYLSAVFPVRTGVFPAQPDPNFDIATWEEELGMYFEQLQAASGDGFAPSLATLDGWVEGISLREP
jgi:hypothetical protein